MQSFKIPSSMTDLASGLSDSTPAAAAATKKSGKLHEAAQQFEALMIGEMMKSVRESSDSGWLGTNGDDPSTDQATEMAEQHFAKALAMGGGLGLSKMVEQKVGQQSGLTSDK